MTDSSPANINEVRALVVIVAVGLIVGSAISHDKIAAQMFGVLGGAFLPLIALLYEVNL